HAQFSEIGHAYVHFGDKLLDSLKQFLRGTDDQGIGTLVCHSKNTCRRRISAGAAAATTTAITAPAAISTTAAKGTARAAARPSTAAQESIQKLGTTIVAALGRGLEQLFHGGSQFGCIGILQREHSNRGHTRNRRVECLNDLSYSADIRLRAGQDEGIAALIGRESRVGGKKRLQVLDQLRGVGVL